MNDSHGFVKGTLDDMPMLQLALRHVEQPDALDINELDQLITWLEAGGTARIAWLSRQFQMHDQVDRALAADRVAFARQCQQRLRDAQQPLQARRVVPKASTTARPRWWKDWRLAASLAFCAVLLAVVVAASGTMTSPVMIEFADGRRLPCKPGDSLELRDQERARVVWPNGDAVQVQGPGSLALVSAPQPEIQWSGPSMSATAAAATVRIHHQRGQIVLADAAVRAFAATHAWLISAEYGLPHVVTQRNDGSFATSSISSETVAVVRASGEVVMRERDPSRALGELDDVDDADAPGFLALAPLAMLASVDQLQIEAKSASSGKRATRLPFALRISDWPSNHVWTLRPARLRMTATKPLMPLPFSGNCWDIRSIGSLGRESDPQSGQPVLALRNLTGPRSAQLLVWKPFIAEGPGTVRIRIRYQTTTREGTRLRISFVDDQGKHRRALEHALPGTERAWEESTRVFPVEQGTTIFHISLAAASRRADEPLLISALTIDQEATP